MEVCVAEAHKNVVPDPGCFPAHVPPQRSRQCSLDACKHTFSTAAQRQHDVLCAVFETITRQYAPPDELASAEPLLIRVHAAQRVGVDQERFVLVMFHTRRQPMDICVSVLQPTTHMPHICPLAAPFELRVREEVPLLSHQVFCKQLLSTGFDHKWAILRVGEVEDLRVFRVTEVEEVEASAMLTMEKQRRDAAAASSSALRHVQDLFGHGPGEGEEELRVGAASSGAAPARSISVCGPNQDVMMSDADSVMEEGSDTDNFEAMAGLIEQAGEMGATHGAAAKPAARPRQARAEIWGPFQLAPIFPNGVFSAWGATCGRHRNPGSKLQCRKTCTFAGGALGITAAQAKVRLKRWLLAGVNDAQWPAWKRDYHRSLGGPGLEGFGEGEPEHLLDAAAAALVAS